MYQTLILLIVNVVFFNFNLLANTCKVSFNETTANANCSGEVNGKMYSADASIDKSGAGIDFDRQIACMNCYNEIAKKSTNGQISANEITIGLGTVEIKASPKNQPAADVSPSTSRPQEITMVSAQNYSISPNANSITQHDYSAFNQAAAKCTQYGGFLSSGGGIITCKDGVTTINVNTGAVGNLITDQETMSITTQQPSVSQLPTLSSNSSTSIIRDSKPMDLLNAKGKFITNEQNAECLENRPNQFKNYWECVSQYKKDNEADVKANGKNSKYAQLSAFKTITNNDDIINSLKLIGKAKPTERVVDEFRPAKISNEGQAAPVNGSVDQGPNTNNQIQLSTSPTPQKSLAVEEKLSSPSIKSNVSSSAEAVVDNKNTNNDSANFSVFNQAAAKCKNHLNFSTSAGGIITCGDGVKVEIKTGEVISKQETVQAPLKLDFSSLGSSNSDSTSSIPTQSITQLASGNQSPQKVVGNSKENADIFKNCDDKLVDSIRNLIKSDKNNILGKQFELTSLKLAMRVLSEKNKNISTAEDLARNIENKITDTDKESITHKMTLLYRKNMQDQDASFLETKLEKLSNANYWEKDNRIYNEDMSALILADIATNKNTKLNETDAAMAWLSKEVQSKMSKGSSESNLSNMSFWVQKYTGAMDGKYNNSIDVLQKNISQIEQQQKKGFENIARMASNDIRECFLNNQFKGAGSCWSGSSPEFHDHLTQAITSIVDKLKEDSNYNLKFNRNLRGKIGDKFNIKFEGI